jgi:hypothetical protein
MRIAMGLIQQRRAAEFFQVLAALAPRLIVEQASGVLTELRIA